VITTKKGNIFATECQTIVNTVNCVGVMGAGIAYEFRLRYPQMYEKYRELCKEKKLNIGLLWLYRDEPDKKWVLNFPTKYHWKYESKVEYLQKGLQKFLDTYKEKGITSIAFPLLGASNGGIPEDVSLEVMNKYLNKCTDIAVEIYHFDPYAYDDLFLNFKKICNEVPENVLKKELKVLHEKNNDELRLKLMKLIADGEEKNRREIEKINEKLNEKMISIAVIKKALESQSIRSMNGLLRAKGIGDKTLEKAFHFINNYRNIAKLYKLDDLWS
jgi:O-acetyl-ADP-ribose deacetylase (regulator of RNase III)